jgi:hypothetical protein
VDKQTNDREEIMKGLCQQAISNIMENDWQKPQNKQRDNGVPRNFFGGGSTNSVEDRENGDLGAVAPYSGVPPNLQISETRILITVFYGL